MPYIVRYFSITSLDYLILERFFLFALKTFLSYRSAEEKIQGKQAKCLSVVTKRGWPLGL